MFKLSLLLATGFLISCTSKNPGELGFQNGKFSDCQDNPCFSTTDSDPKKKIDSLKYSGAVELALAEMKKYAQMLGDPIIEKEEAEYLHLKYESIFGTDDLEIYVNKEASKIEYKTSSRSSFDFGSNKSRAHGLAFKFIQKGM
jgi:uncharacterized protein (DUF1499 family)